MNSVQDHLPVTTHESGIDAVSLAQELIRIDTCQSGVGDVEALRLLGRFVEAAGASWELFWEDGVAAGLVARWGTGAARLALCGHIDTVPADPAGWTRPPLSGAVERGKLHGRGSCDMKGALAAMAVALRDVAATDPRRWQTSPWSSPRRRRSTPRAPGRCSRWVSSMAWSGC